MWLLIKNLLFTLGVPGTVAGYVPWYLVRDAELSGVAWMLAGALFLIVGGGIYLWCLWDFATFGRGTPAPIDPPKSLVVRGLYHSTRNPKYVGVVTVIFGWALLFRSLDALIYGLIVWSFFHGFVTLYEEPTLRALFADNYDDYCARVGRWLPKLRGGSR